MMRKAKAFLFGMALLILLAVGGLVLPDREKSDLENRVLASAPAFSLSSFSDGRWTSSLETYTADQLPLRDAFVSLYTSSEAALGFRASGGVILGSGRLFDRTDGWKERNVVLNARALSHLSELTGVPVYLLAVPSAAAVYPDQLPANAPMADEEKLLASAEKETNLIPLLDSLRKETRDSDQNLFYRTDHHWTAAGARAGYLCACLALGLDPLPEEEYAVYPGFYGSFYSRFPLPWMGSDDFQYPLEEGEKLLVDGELLPGLLDRDAVELRDKYAALLYGNHPYMEITNDQAPEGRLFVIKDSYANALLPALSRHYQCITAVDARYFTGNVAEAVTSSKGEAVLCVYGLSTLSTGRTISLLNGL